MQTLTHEQTENIYSVTRLNSEIKQLLEGTFPFVWVEGEISNFSAPHSGHWYFSLKDPTAQVRCAMFRGQKRKLDFLPKDGSHVLIKARVSLYENRGEYQLIAEHIEERGEGKLRKAYEALKKKLEAAGLFDPAKKKTLPAYPKQIGIITSATGAALRDILNVLKRRFNCTPIVIYPTLVQGNEAKFSIVEAIKKANARSECDVLILARGGGSLEDLWPFNEESVAFAISESELPIVSGVGHEVDFTIADFVADLRAPTPSAAAEMVTPDCNELIQHINHYKRRIWRQIQTTVKSYQEKIGWTEKHLHQQHPKKRLQEKMQRLDSFEQALINLQQKLISKHLAKTKEFEARLLRQTPLTHITKIHHQLSILTQRSHHIIGITLTAIRTKLTNFSGKLNAISPLATLNRGYAIPTNKNDEVIHSIHQIKPNEMIHVKLADGELDCIVNEIKFLDNV